MPYAKGIYASPFVQKCIRSSIWFLGFTLVFFGGNSQDFTMWVTFWWSPNKNHWVGNIWPWMVKQILGIHLTSKEISHIQIQDLNIDKTFNFEHWFWIWKTNFPVESRRYRICFTHKWLRCIDYVPQRGNPRFFQCLLDEDMIRRASCLSYCQFSFAGFFQKKLKCDILELITCNNLWPFKVKGICKGLHPKVFAERALQHYCMSVTLRWTGMLQMWVQKKGFSNLCALSRKMVANGGMFTHA